MGQEVDTELVFQCPEGHDPISATSLYTISTGAARVPRALLCGNRSLPGNGDNIDKADAQRVVAAQKLVQSTGAFPAGTKSLVRRGRSRIQTYTEACSISQSGRVRRKKVAGAASIISSEEDDVRLAGFIGTIAPCGEDSFLGWTMF